MNQTGIILTGASTGLGLALGNEALKQGACVTSISRSQPVFSCSEKTQWQQADLSGKFNAHQLIQNALNFLITQNCTRILLLNNAGSVDPMNLCGHYPDEVVTSSITLNVTAPLLLINAFTAQLPTTIQGNVLNISSGAAHTAYPGWGIYCATKAALDQFTRVFAAEQKHIKAVSMAPGIIDTNMQQHIRAQNEAKFPLVERFIQIQQDGKLASPTDTAQKILRHYNSPSFAEETVVDIRDLK